MKKFFKTLVALAAGALFLSLSSCSNDTDSGNGSDSSSSTQSTSSTTGSAIFYSSVYWYGTIKLKYETDGTYLMTWSLGEYNESSATNKGKGTYTLTGTFENGTIHQHQTHTSDTLSSEWEEETEDVDLVISNGVFTHELPDPQGTRDITFTKSSSSN